MAGLGLGGKLRRLDELIGTPVNLVVFFMYRDWPQAPAFARTAGALAAFWNIQRAMRRTHQVQAARLEKFAFGPVEFNRHVGAAVQVAVNLAVIPHDETGCRV